MEQFLAIFDATSLSDVFYRFIVAPFQSQSFGYNDVLDILVLAVFLFYGYKFIRDRRAGKLIIGLAFLCAMFFISYILRLETVNYIFQNFYQVGVLAIVIMFQPELRDALEQVGNTPSNFKNFGQSKSSGEFEKAISEICEAATELSATKTGALIAIERGTKLGDFIKSGQEIDAKISSKLLRNLFFNKSPLHDGAVVIRGLRVSYAGCILPVSKRDSMFVNMGTRHRSAVGLTEVSDAVVIVVSEETGTISIACNGMLKRFENPSHFRAALFQQLTGNPGDDFVVNADKPAVPPELPETMPERTHSSGGGADVTKNENETGGAEDGKTE